MMPLNMPQIEYNTHWWDRFKPKNWLHETKDQEFLRRLQAVESSVQNAHDRINHFDERLANGRSDNSGS